jgi:hypothetical protein
MLPMSSSAAKATCHLFNMSTRMMRKFLIFYKIAKCPPACSTCILAQTVPCRLGIPMQHGAAKAKGRGAATTDHESPPAYLRG